MATSATGGVISSMPRQARLGAPIEIPPLALAVFPLRASPSVYDLGAPAKKPMVVCL
jgi:hypothetical protein